MWDSKRIKRPAVKEERMQIQVCNFLKRGYPHVIFTCDLSSGMKLTIGQAVKASKMRSGSGLPDLMIFEARGKYFGLMLELKRQGTNVFKKDGTIKSDQHLQKQNAILERLREKGYKAEFVEGIEDTVTEINYYMSLPKNSFTI